MLAVRLRLRRQPWDGEMRYPIKPLAGVDAAKRRKAGADIGVITRHSERGRQAERRISCVSCRLGWTDEALYPYAARQASFCGWQEIPRVARNGREGTHGAWARRGSPSGRLRLPPPSPEGGKGVFAAMWRVVIAGRRSGRCRPGSAVGMRFLALLGMTGTTT